MTHDELWKLYGEPAAKAAFAAGHTAGFEDGEKIGFLKGEIIGKRDGFVLAMNMVKPALSDGLRHGSPVCGSAMRSLQDLMPDFVTDEELADSFEKDLNIQ
ncbi:hypothetical protein ACTXNP_22190 [Pseudomonas helleri]|uniref:hypothetical protein n=1 Tax=Pseudomonas helleri TaxID=1608996 RepID=UPI003FD0B6B2